VVGATETWIRRTVNDDRIDGLITTVADRTSMGAGVVMLHLLVGEYAQDAQDAPLDGCFLVYSKPRSLENPLGSISRPLPPDSFRYVRKYDRRYSRR